MQPTMQWKSNKYYTTSLCVFVALGTQREIGMRHIISCRLSCCTIFFPHYLINGKIFEKKNCNEHKMCVLILSATFV